MIQEVSRRYDAYRDSGIEWVGDIPDHWELRRVKELGSLVLGKMLDNNQGSDKLLRPYLKSKNIGWLKVTDSNVEEMYFSAYEIKLYRIKLGDLLLSEGGEVGKTAYWNEEVEECYIQNSVHKFTVNKNNNSRYLLYLSFAVGHAKYYDNIVNFVSIKHLTKEKLSRVVWLSPHRREQKDIVNYLDTKTAQIDKKIDLLTQKTAHYSKLKQALINEIVTHGLDKTVPMKDSGIEWIGDIPEHWEVMRLKDVATMRTGNSLNDTLKERFSNKIIENTPYVATKDIDLATYSVNINNGVYIPNSESKYKKAPSYSTLLCVEGGSAGKKMTFVKQSVCYVNKLLCFSNNVKVNSLFLHYFIRSTPFVSKFNTCLTGLKDNYWGVTGSQISRFKTLVPPLVEQEAIADYLDKKTAKIDTIVKTINTQIDKLKELRKTLINDVVTGQIKVIQE